MGYKTECLSCEEADYIAIPNEEDSSVTLICGRCNSQITLPLKEEE